MRGKNRNPIASRLKLPQFTTMNVIDGQAGFICYASLIFYSLTIDNILNIIVLLILVGVTISAIVRENGVINGANNARVQTEIAKTKADVESKEAAMAAESISNCNFILEHIKDKNALKIVNIF